MRVKTFETVCVVCQLRCDRCGKEADRGEVGFEQMTSISFDAGYGSIFGDGKRVEIDLCLTCLHDTLGPWLQVTTPVNTHLANKLLAFKPDMHGGEFPRGDDL